MSNDELSKAFVNEKRILNIFYIIIGVAIGAFFFFLTYKANSEALNSIKALSSVFIACTFVIAIKQLAFNAKQAEYVKDWNIKQLTMTEISKNESTVNSCIEFLDAKIHYRERTESISFDEIHNQMGRFISNDEKQSLSKNQTKRVSEYNDKIFLFNKEGKRIKDSITKLLSATEYLSTGINDGTLNDKLAYKIMGAKLIYIVFIFEDYIEHLRIYHKWGNSVYSEMETVKNRWIEYKEAEKKAKS